jgi:hypothetical protein
MKHFFSVILLLISCSVFAQTQGELITFQAGTKTVLTTASAAALNADMLVSTDCSAYKVLNIQVTTITSGNRLTVQGSNDNTSFDDLSVRAEGRNKRNITQISQTGSYQLSFTHKWIRVRMTNFASGTASGIVTGMTVTPSGSASGINEANNFRHTTGFFAPAALATDVFTITGAANVTVRIKSIEISGTETASARQLVVLIKRTTANTGGTSNAGTAAQDDTWQATANATRAHYTANPATLGTGSAFWSGRVMVPTTTALTNDGLRIVFDQPIALHGVNELLAINLNGVTWTGANIAINVEWEEEK